MPAFAKGDQGQHPIVATAVCGFETAAPEEVSQRVDGEGAVVKQHSRDHVAPHKGPRAP